MPCPKGGSPLILSFLSPRCTQCKEFSIFLQPALGSTLHTFLAKFIFFWEREDWTGIISNFPLVSTLHTCRAALHPAPIRTQSLQESTTQQMPGRVCSVLGLCWRLGSAVNRWSLMLALVPHGGLGLGFSTSHSHTPALVNEVFL